MRGDFSRLTFNKDAGFTQVLFQQGQDLVESDFNEQAAILRDQIRATGEFAALVQRKAGPQTFEVTDVEKKEIPAGNDNRASRTVSADFKGSVFVPGVGKVTWETDKGVLYTFPNLDPTIQFLSLILDTTEEPVRVDTDPQHWLTDTALAVGNAALRLRPVHRIIALQHDKLPVSTTLDATSKELLANRYQPGTGNLRPIIGSGESSAATDECAPLPDDRFQGVENQLYRVEVQSVSKDSKLEVKFSRDNGAAAYRVTSIAPDQDGQKLAVTLAGSWEDQWWRIQANSVVELISVAQPGPVGIEDSVDPLPLLTVEHVEPGTDAITLTLTGWKKTQIKAAVDNAAAGILPILVRWDHELDPGQTAGGRVVQLTDGKATLRLEDDLSVEFQGTATNFQVGDYWLIPVRMATGAALWPTDGDTYKLLPPKGPAHVYTPLVLVDLVPTLPLVKRYPLDAPDQLKGAGLQPAIVAGVPTAGGDQSFSIDLTKPQVEIAIDLDKILFPIRWIFSARQLLIASPKAVEPMLPIAVKKEDLVEAARRLSFDPKLLLRQIVKGVNAALLDPQVLPALVNKEHPNGGPWTPIRLLESDKNVEPMALTGAQPKFKDKFKLISDLAAADSPTIVAKKVKGGEEAPTAEEEKEVTSWWQNARRIKFFLLAWPFETITEADWKTV